MLYQKIESVLRHLENNTLRPYRSVMQGATLYILMLLHRSHDSPQPPLYVYIEYFK